MDPSLLTPAEFDFSLDLFTSGGMWGNVVATITDLKFSAESPMIYAQKTKGKLPLWLYVTYTLEDGVVEQSEYSLGGTSADHFIPDPTGYSLARNPDVPGSENATLKKGTGFYHWRESLNQQGVPETLFKSNLKGLIGLQGFWVRKVFKFEGQEDMPVAQPAPGQQERKRDPIGTLILARLDKLSGGKLAGTVNKTGAGAAKVGAAAAAKASGSASTATAAAPAAPVAAAGGATQVLSLEGVDTSDAITYLGTLLQANGGSVEVAAVTKTLFTAIKVVGVRNEVKKLMGDPAALAENFGAALADGVISIA